MSSEDRVFRCRKHDVAFHSTAFSQYLVKNSISEILAIVRPGCKIVCLTERENQLKTPKQLLTIDDWPLDDRVLISQGFQDLYLNVLMCSSFTTIQRALRPNITLHK